MIFPGGVEIEVIEPSLHVRSEFMKQRLYSRLEVACRVR